MAEQEVTPLFTVQNGVPAGCRQAPLLAKAVLAPALQPWKAQESIPPAGSMMSGLTQPGDLQCKWPRQVQVAKTAVAAYRDLQQRLVALGLQVNPKKTAFIATDKATDKELRALLQPDEPPVESVTRDLGVDHQAARRRRIPVMKQRLTKASHRKLKLRALKIPALKV